MFCDPGARDCKQIIFILKKKCCRLKTARPACREKIALSDIDYRIGGEPLANPCLCFDALPSTPNGIGYTKTFYWVFLNFVFVSKYI
jgi:hypothetical protein